ncbi:hypothetical protein K2X92_04650 [Candidatus Gracilibacteria bacterium]|nr:hypothetical protein [Candidatus Gracilibacteria bacterium]
MLKKTFSLNNQLYPESDIRNAIDTFDGYLILWENGTLTIEDENPQFVFDELMNYILSLSLENSIGA